MRSKASIKGHPIHAMLIAFPVAFATAAPLADLAATLGDWPSLWTVGAYSSIAAVVTGFIAGVPGFIDYLTVVPPNSSAKTRATYHMIVNVVALGVMAASWWFRNWETLVPENMAIVLEFASIGIMSVGGWMGATLVYRNQIGVDHRYAEAGKWQEQYLDADASGYVHVKDAEELDVDQMILVHVDGRRLVLARTEKGFTAFDDFCTHKGGSLAGGMMACGTVMCPWHGSQFDVNTGAVKAGPAKKGISAYPVDHSTGDVRIFVGSKSAVKEKAAATN
jgi:nitrite reductase/ring-hydroxylating ferredoxin subunit/uncharacterized membrane protein